MRNPSWPIPILLDGDPPVLTPLLPATSRHEWVARCCFSIFEREPALGEGDVLDLAATLWDRSKCRDMLPELAASRLLAGELKRL